MPNMDGTGPWGHGPRGQCNRLGAAEASDENCPRGQRGCRRRMRRGRGRACNAPTGAAATVAQPGA